MSAGAVWLIINKKFKSFFTYSVISLVVFLLYFTDVILYDSWKEYFYQTSNDPATNALRNVREKIFNITKIVTVKPEYNKNIFIDCFNTSEVLNDKKFVRDFFKLSS